LLALLRVIIEGRSMSRAFLYSLAWYFPFPLCFPCIDGLFSMFMLSPWERIAIHCSVIQICSGCLDLMFDNDWIVSISLLLHWSSSRPTKTRKPVTESALVFPRRKPEVVLSPKRQNAIAEIADFVSAHILKTAHSLVGLSGLLNPPTRFMYCLYSVFLSFLTPYNLSFPGTFVFFVLLNPTKPINLFIAVSSSSPGSITAAGAVSCAGLRCC
jgi:hypothetical protein